MSENCIHNESKTLHTAITHLTPLWAKDLTHHYVYDMGLKKLRGATEIIGYDIKNVLDLRANLKSENHKMWRYRCRECEERLILVCSKNQDGFHFRHLAPNSKCSIIDGHILPGNVLRAIKFHGQQESRAHAELKWHLLFLIHQDGRFKNAKVEEWQRDEETGEKRRPDILAEFEGQTVAFEIQISTESVTTIIKRQQFYKKKGWILAWIFQEYNFNSPRVSDLDIVNSANWNALSLNEAALCKSTETGKLYLKCTYLEDMVTNKNAVATEVRTAMVNFSELTLDFTNGRLYYFDYEKNKRECDELKKEYRLAAFEAKLDIDDLRRGDNHKVSKLIKEIYGIDQSGNRNLIPQLSALFTAKRGTPVGWNYKKIVQVFHVIFDNYKPLLFIFLCALEVYENRLSKSDEKVKQRKLTMWRALKSDPHFSEYAPDRTIEEVARLIFSEVFAFYWEQGTKYHLFN